MSEHPAKHGVALYDLRRDFEDMDLLPLRGLARRLSDAVHAVLDLHQRRTRTVEGYTLQWCVECQQDWPCATLRAMPGNNDSTRHD